jgi:hypothetical protein
MGSFVKMVKGCFMAGLEMDSFVKGLMMGSYAGNLMTGAFMVSTEQFLETLNDGQPCLQFRSKPNVGSYGIISWQAL